MALEGSLQDMSMIDLFQVFQMGPKTGILVLERGTERGVVYVANGALNDAILIRRNEHEVIAIAEKAVLQLLQWDDASFVFTHNPAVHDHTARITHDIDWFIAESERLQKEVQQTPQETSNPITLQSQFRLKSHPGMIDSKVHLTLEQWRVLSHVAIDQSLETICYAMGLSVDKILQAVRELVDLGLLEMVSQSASKPATSYKPIVSPKVTPQPPPVRSARVDSRLLASNRAMSAPGRTLLHAIRRRIHSL